MQSQAKKQADAYALTCAETSTSAPCARCSKSLPSGRGVFGIRLEDQQLVCDSCLVHAAFPLGRVLILDQFILEVGSKLDDLVKGYDALPHSYVVEENRRLTNLLAAYARAHAVAGEPSRLTGLANGIIQIAMTPETENRIV